MVCHHRVSSPCELRRMVRSKSLEVTGTSLTTRYARLSNSSRCDTYCLSKGLLIKYRRLVECRWCLTNAQWTTSASSPSTSHLHNQHGSQYTIQFPRHKHSPETLIIHKTSVYISSSYIYEAMQDHLSTNQIILITKILFFSKILANFI